MLTQSDFTILFERYSTSLLGYVRGYVNDVDTAKDIVNECFMVLWDQRFAITNPLTLSSLLFKIARNKSLNHIKHLQVIQRNESILIDILQNHESNIDEQSYMEVITHLNSVIDSLPDMQRKVLYLFFIENKSFVQIAKELDLHVNTIKTHLYRAIDRLKISVKSFENIALYIMIVNVCKK